jgi:predicted permease
VSRDYFRVLGSRAAAGRLIDRSDAARGDLVAVVSHRFWRDRLGAESIAGRTLTIAGRSVPVIGVLPDGFQGPGGLFAPDVWLPLEHADTLGLPRRLLTQQEPWLTVVGRLAGGVTPAQAEADLAALASRLPAPADPKDARERRLGFFAMRDGHPEVRGLAPYVWIAMAVIGIVLLIACFNVAALLLARAAERQREIGIRTALGAGRWRIVRQLVTEGIVLAVLGGCAALAAAAWSGRLLAAFSLPAPIPQRLDLQVDARIILFTAMVALAAGVLPALLPALQATRRDLVRSMRIGGAGDRRRSRARAAFVTAQIAGSTLFLAVALLFVRSFWNASAVDLGFDPAGLVVAELRPATYGFEGDRAASFARDLVARVAAAPGTIAAVADGVPYSVGYPRTQTVSTATLDCAVQECKPIRVYSVGRGHFDALGLPLEAGRDFSEAELTSSGAVVVNAALAAKLWPGQTAIGQVVRLGTERTPASVVGVAGNVTPGYSSQPPAPAFYVPIGRGGFDNGFTLLARTRGSEATTIAAVRDAVHAIAPSMPVSSLTTMTGRLALPMWPRRTAAGFFLTCGALALLLATVGLFGVTYFAVRQRTREFGVRIALGARGSDVVRQVLGEGVRLAVPGALAGLALAAIAGRLLARTLLGVSPIDPASFGGAAAIEIAVALLACAIPARRAAQADPIVALRDDN